jgi:hypothetical protein
MATLRNRVGVTMDAGSVVNPAVVRKIDGFFSRIYHRFNIGKLLCDLVNEETLLYFFLIAVSDRKNLNFHRNENICTLHETDMSLMPSIIDGLISRLLLSFCVLSDTSFFSDDFLFCWGSTG